MFAGDAFLTTPAVPFSQERSMRSTSLSRRGFLATAAALGVGSRLTASFRADDPFGGFTVGAQSYSFRNFDLEPALKRTKDLGLHYVEFYNKHVPLNSTPEKIASVKKLSAEYGITPIAFGVEKFTKNHDAN